MGKKIKEYYISIDIEANGPCPRSWFNPKLKHTHNALDDAKEQMFIHLSMMNALKALHQGVSICNQSTPKLKCP